MTTDQSRDRQWFIAGRWQEFEGESRANLMRIIGTGGFYVVELVNRQNVSPAFHSAVTAMAAAWVISAWSVFILLKRHVFPETMKFFSTGVDLLLFTCLLLIADGPRSPLVVGYFFILCLAALRFSVPLLQFTTAGAVVGYLAVAEQAAWKRKDLVVEMNGKLIIVLTIVLCGIALGQVIRRVRSFSEDYARRLEQQP